MGDHRTAITIGALFGLSVACGGAPPSSARSDEPSSTALAEGASEHASPTLLEVEGSFQPVALAALPGGDYVLAGAGTEPIRLPNGVVELEGYDGYAMRLGPDGALRWALTIRGEGNHMVEHATVDSSGEWILIAGELDASTTVGSVPLDPAVRRPFVARVRLTDGDVAWAVIHEGPLEDLAAGPDGHALLVGGGRVVLLDRDDGSERWARRLVTGIDAYVRAGPRGICVAIVSRDELGPGYAELPPLGLSDVLMFWIDVDVSVLGVARYGEAEAGAELHLGELYEGGLEVLPDGSCVVGGRYSGQPSFGDTRFPTPDGDGYAAWFARFAGPDAAPWARSFLDEEGPRPIVVARIVPSADGLAALLIVDQPGAPEGTSPYGFALAWLDADGAIGAREELGVYDAFESLRMATLPDGGVLISGVDLASETRRVFVRRYARPAF